MVNARDIEDIKKKLKPAQKYLGYNFKTQYWNKFLTLKPPKVLEAGLNVEERKKHRKEYRKLILDKFARLVNTDVQIMAKNEEINPELYNKPPINAEYIKNLLDKAKKEVRETPGYKWKWF